MTRPARGHASLLRLRRAVQPHAARLPKVVHRVAGRMLDRVSTGDPEQLLDDWSRPLIGDGTCALVRPDAARVVPAALPGRHRPARVTQRELSCVLVTARLDVGGMDEVIRSHVERLPALGFRVSVLQAQDPAEELLPFGRTGEELQAQGIEVVDHRREDLQGWLAAQQPDVVSVHGGATWAIELASDQGLPCVETLHGMHFLFDADPAEVRRRDAMLDAVVSVSELLREQYLQACPTADPDRVVTIPNGVDFGDRGLVSRDEARAALGLGNEYLFTSLARHCVQKNTYGLIAAFEDVAKTHPDAHLLIAGRPDSAAYLAQCARLRASMPGGDRVHLRDHAPEPALLLAASDGFVLDSFFEGWALASMEALVMGVPVVCADVGGAREQLAGPNPPGFLVGNPLGDPVDVSWDSIRRWQYQRQVNRDALVAAMNSLVSDRESWRERATGIAAESTARFDLDAAVRRHAHVLRSVAAHRPLLAAVE